MPTIEISEADFQRLQKIAVPLIDTPKTLITKLLDCYEGHQKALLSKPAVSTHPGIEHYDPNSIPPLTHTKLLAARFDNVTPAETKWNSLMQLALTRTME